MMYLVDFPRSRWKAIAAMIHLRQKVEWLIKLRCSFEAVIK